VFTVLVILLELLLKVVQPEVDVGYGPLHYFIITRLFRLIWRWLLFTTRKVDILDTLFVLVGVMYELFHRDTIIRLVDM
jgi:hypothetical protein